MVWRISVAWTASIVSPPSGVFWSSSPTICVVAPICSRAQNCASRALVATVIACDHYRPCTSIIVSRSRWTNDTTRIITRVITAVELLRLTRPLETIRHRLAVVTNRRLDPNTYRVSVTACRRSISARVAIPSAILRALLRPVPERIPFSSRRRWRGCAVLSRQKTSLA